MFRLPQGQASDTNNILSVSLFTTKRQHMLSPYVPTNVEFNHRGKQGFVFLFFIILFFFFHTWKKLSINLLIKFWMFFLQILIRKTLLQLFSHYNFSSREQLKAVLINSSLSKSRLNGKTFFRQFFSS